MPRSDLQDFADAVVERLAREPAHSPYRFGRTKVFIAALDPSRHTKRLLVEAHQAGLLRLSRADLTPAMSRAMVRDSEVRGGPGGMSEWHLVTVPSAERDRASRARGRDSRARSAGRSRRDAR